MASKTSGRVRTNQAIRPKSPEDQRRALNNIAFGDGWTKFVNEIEAQLEPYAPQEPIRQSTSRALEMIKDMAFDRL